MKKLINEKTDCWRCGRTFGKPKTGEIKIAGFIFIEPNVRAYDQDDILCTDCIDEEIEEGLKIR